MLRRLFRSEFVTLLVGKDKTVLRAHKDLLCVKSKFFEGCLEGNFSEAGHRIVSLPDDEIDAVGTFLIWVYFGICDFDPRILSINNMVARYGFGDKILAEAYCNDILDTIRFYSKGGVPRLELRCRTPASPCWTSSLSDGVVRAVRSHACDNDRQGLRTKGERGQWAADEVVA